MAEEHKKKEQNRKHMKSKIVYSISSLLDLKHPSRVCLEVPYEQEKDRMQEDYPVGIENNPIGIEMPTNSPRFIPFGSLIIKIIPGMPIPPGAIPLLPFFRPNWPFMVPEPIHPMHTCVEESLSASSDYSIQIQLPPV